MESRKAIVHVYRLSDGVKIGQMTPGPEVFGESGWVDFRDAIRAIRRVNGEYLVFVEEDAKGKTLFTVLRTNRRLQAGDARLFHEFLKHREVRFVNAAGWSPG